ncbi:MAG: pyruvate dehydrogenase complex dihydrolipoamide acetyltransferase [Alphaproteobacteria bacterium]|nr:MAG: pyruvate dehydrogenase complex dihydrolipoamide acetyltransferase [Alphaproteobacteria bacterium]
MPIEILMPALSPTMEEGTLAKWLVKEGDTVSSGDVIAEIETDKAVMEFEAADDGRIGRILVPEGSEGVKVNTPIAILLQDGEEAGDTATPAAAAQPPTPPAAATEAARPAASPAPPSATAAAVPAEAPGSRVFASPLARRIAAEKGLDLERIAGSGPNGRIVKADVEAASVTAGLAAAPAAPATPAAPAAPAPQPQQPAPAADRVARLYEGREFEEIPLDAMRRTIAERLTEAKRDVPHFYLRREIGLDALIALRSELNFSLEARGIKLSVNDFIIRATALALQDVPDCNAVWAGDRLLRLARSDVAVAVAVEGGLFTPVIRDADLKTLSAISVEMKALAERARARKLAPYEYKGGSFTISNLGMMGIESFDAVINPPQAAILAVGAGLQKPVVGKDGTVGVATSMSVTLSVDHRVIDGALGARFLAALKGRLEDPISILA